MVYENKEDIERVLSVHGINNIAIEKMIGKERWDTIDKENPVMKIKTEHEDIENGNDLIIYYGIHLYLRSSSQYVNFTFVNNHPEEVNA
jgi:hypothetical protein